MSKSKPGRNFVALARLVNAYMPLLLGERSEPDTPMRVALGLSAG